MNVYFTWNIEIENREWNLIKLRCSLMQQGWVGRGCNKNDTGVLKTNKKIFVYSEGATIPLIEMKHRYLYSVTNYVPWSLELCLAIDSNLNYLDWGACLITYWSLHLNRIDIYSVMCITVFLIEIKCTVHRIAKKYDRMN